MHGYVRPLFVLAFMLFAAHAQAQMVKGDFVTGAGLQAPNHDSVNVPGLGMGLPSYGGTGCPAGTVATTLSADQKTLTILFDSFVARAGGATGLQQHLLNCTIHIPFSVPPGYSAQVVKLDYRGFAHIPAGGAVNFTAALRYTGLNLPNTLTPQASKSAQMYGPYQSNFELSTIMNGQSFSPCGQSFTLQADSFLAVGTNQAFEEVLSSVDSIDAVQMPLKLELRWVQCGGPPPNIIYPPGPQPGWPPPHHGPPGWPGPRPGWPKWPPRWPGR
jgi:hypothetical protein